MTIARSPSDDGFAMVWVKRIWVASRVTVLRRVGGVVALSLAVFVTVLLVRNKPKPIPPPAASPETFVCKSFTPSSSFQTIHSPTLARMPVASCRWQDHWHWVCNYEQLQLVNIQTGEVERVPAPTNVKHWSPTTVWADATTQTVFVTNMTGRDAFEFTYQQQQLTLVRRYADADMKEPKGIDVSDDGQLVAISDYEANRVWLFRRDGSLVWDRDVGLAHGVAFTPQGIVVSGLEKRELVQFDLAGNLVRREGTQGWEDNRYLWPTTVLHDGEQLLISDAHQGTLTVVDHTLQQRERIGGNGAGTGLFNMPYGVAVDDDFIVVCDSFKDRLVVLDRQWECQRIISLHVHDESWIDAPSVGPSLHHGYTNVATPISLNIPHLSIPTVYPSYGGYARTNQPYAHLVYFPLSGSVFNSRGYPYFCWAIHASHSGQSYTILGHSQVTNTDGTTQVLVIDQRGRCVIGETNQQLWVVNGISYTNTGQRFDWSSILETAREDLATFEQRVAEAKSTLDPLRQVLLPNHSAANFQTSIGQSFVTDAGKAFWRDWRAAQSPAEKVKAADAFDQALAATDKQHVYLQEVLLRNMLVP